MKRMIGIIVLIMTAAAALPQERRVMSLSLDDCIVRAVKNNLYIAAEVITPELADISVSLANEKFMPSLSFSFNNQKTNSASYSWIDAAVLIQTSLQDYSISMDQLIPTGGRFNIALSSYKNDTNRGLQTINPRYGSTLTFNFSQPILKNFGFQVNRREVIIARNSRDVSREQFEQVLLDMIYSVEEAYWNLAYSIENLKVRRQSLELARDLLRENRRKVEVGTMAPIEITTAEAEVATREADILQAEAMVKNYADQLSTIINLPDEESSAPVELLPVDKPDFSEKIVDSAVALETAFQNRPDLKASEINLEIRELDVSYARNQLLPELNLEASYWSPGISGNQILYLNDNPLTGVIIGILPGGASDSLRDALHFKYDNWAVGLTLKIPVSTVFSRAQFAQAAMNLKQDRLRLDNLKKQIILEIKTAVRSVQTDYKRAQAYRAARELADKKLSSEQEKFRVGKSTNYILLQYQRDAADARIAELKALIDYTLSLAVMEKVLGTTFESRNIRFTEIYEKK